MSYPVIAFDPPCESFFHLIDNALIEFTVDLVLTNDAYPHERVVILATTRDNEVVICESDDDGAPQRHSTWNVPIEAIEKIVVL